MGKPLMRVIPDKEKAKSVLRMAEVTSQLISTINAEKFPSNITKEYYEVIRELMTTILLIDGYKTTGEGAHKALIEYLSEKYKQFTEHELSLIEELRIARNRIAYDGFFVTYDYVERHRKTIEAVISKLKGIAAGKLQA